MIERANFGQRRQIAQAAQIEVIEELLGGTEEGRTTGDVAVSNHPDPLALEQRTNDVRTDSDATVSPSRRA